MSDTVTLRELLESKLDASEKRTAGEFIALRHHIDGEFAAQRTAVTAAFAASKEATDKTEREGERYRAVQNEWCGTITDMKSDLMPRAENKAQFDSIISQIRTMQASIDSREGQNKGGADRQSTILVIGFFIIAALTLAAPFVHQTTVQPVVQYVPTQPQPWPGNLSGQAPAKP